MSRVFTWLTPPGVDPTADLVRTLTRISAWDGRPYYFSYVEPARFFPLGVRFRILEFKPKAWRWGQAQLLGSTPGILRGFWVDWQLWQHGAYYGVRRAPSGREFDPSGVLAKVRAQVWERVAVEQPWEGLYGNADNGLIRFGAYRKIGEMAPSFTETRSSPPLRYDLRLYSLHRSYTGPPPAPDTKDIKIDVRLVVTQMNPLEELLWRVENP